MPPFAEGVLSRARALIVPSRPRPRSLVVDHVTRVLFPGRDSLVVRT